MSQPIHRGTNQLGTLKTSNDLPICRACGTQYQVHSTSDSDSDSSPTLKSCRICDDPRQYVPASGQRFTTMGELQQSSAGHKLVFKQEEDPKVWAITIEPSVGIGQRAFLVQTDHGNVLWDLVCYLDEKAVEKVCARIVSPPRPLFLSCSHSSKNHASTIAPLNHPENYQLNHSPPPR